MDKVTQQLDVVRQIRRIRMHGIGLHYILKTSERAGAARMSFSRPLREEEEKSGSEEENSDWNELNDKWAHIDLIDPREKFKIALFKRYSKAIFAATEKPLIERRKSMRASVAESLMNKFENTSVLKNLMRDRKITPNTTRNDTGFKSLD